MRKARKKDSGHDVTDPVAAALAPPVQSAPRSAAAPVDALTPEPRPSVVPALVVVPPEAIDTDAASDAPDEGAPAPGAARTVESMLQEFSGAESGPVQRSDGAPKGKYDQLWQLSMADPHTGLANKLLLLDRLTQALARRRRHGGEVAVCHIDLDNLGEINLDLGYTTGNAVLCEGARRLTAILREEDTVGRVGGSELVVVVAIGDQQDVAPLVRRLQQTLEEPVAAGGQRIRMHSRLGVAVAEADESAEDVLSRADRSTRVSYR